MSFTNYYQLLEIASDASAEDVKRSFRTQIARYHPDKVQHLGREFQSMAADRAADIDGSDGAEGRFKELNEAYRILSDPGRRAEYDRALLEAGGAATSASTAPATAEHQSAPESHSPTAPPT